MLSNEELLIVLRRQMNFYRYQKATAIDLFATSALYRHIRRFLKLQICSSLRRQDLHADLHYHLSSGKSH
jgi:hypothetical protein